MPPRAVIAGPHLRRDGRATLTAGRMGYRTSLSSDRATAAPSIDTGEARPSRATSFHEPDHRTAQDRSQDDRDDYRNDHPRAPSWREARVHLLALGDGEGFE
jgi:hypothetical protein